MTAENIPNSDNFRVYCWCGAREFRRFGPDYLACTACGTLVSQNGLAPEQLRVVNDDSDFYGKNYWLDHQEVDLSQPGVHTRSRSDLPERNLYWLRTLLKYRLPPAKVVELGCAHGSFVALMRQAGFDASGVEMSPWVVSYARETFGIDVNVGPVESLGIARGSLDVIVLMDVMEHLPDPVSTMSYCLDLLKSDGILLIQMPNYVEEFSYEDLVDSDAPFLKQLKADEHLFLYSIRSATEFFRRLGVGYVAFEQAVFAHYDMCMVVSRTPLPVHGQNEIDASLLTPRGRIALALLDMKERYDRAPVYHEHVWELEAAINTSLAEADRVSNERNLVIAQLEDLRGNFSGVEADRLERGRVIEAQGQRISGLEAIIHGYLQQMEELHECVQQLQDERDLGKVQLASWEASLAAVEQDRAARGDVIEDQGRRISFLEGEVHQRLGELELLYPQMEAFRNDANLAGAERDHLLAQVKFAESDRSARGHVIEEQGRRISELEGQVHQRLSELESLFLQLETLRNEGDMVRAERDTLYHERGDLRRHLAETRYELEQAAAGTVRMRLEFDGHLSAAQVRIGDLEQEADRMRMKMDGLETERSALEAARKTMERRLWWKIGRFLRSI